MYLVERYIKILKNYVRSMARPKTCMEEGYLKEECLSFVTKYLQRFHIDQMHVWDAEDEFGDVKEVLEGVSRPFMMSTTLRDVAYDYVLNNVAILEPFWKKVSLVN